MRDCLQPEAWSTEVPVIELSGLSEAQCRALAIADNQLAITGVDVVIQEAEPRLEWVVTYFRVGNSNRTFHKVDWAVRSEFAVMASA